MELAAECHSLAKRLSRRSAAALAGQVQRASLSIPSNIAEGCGRRTRSDYVRHLSMANGSLLELETQLLLIGRLKLLQPDDLSRALSLTIEVGRMLSGVIRKLKEGSAA